MTAARPLHVLSDSHSKGVRERRFDLDRDALRVPGMLWTPTEPTAPRPLVLLGHGASGHKGQDYVVSMARRLVLHRGLAAASIDGPVHGDRRRQGADHGSGAVFLHFAQAWSSDDRMTDEMVADLVGTVDALQSLEEIGTGPVGWWGLSMGTILGLPFVAAEPRMAVAVLGCMGMTGPTRARIEADAPKVTCPILFLMQWDDELFARETAFALFDALGSKDKRLHASAGRHASVPDEEFLASEEFLARYLGTGSQ
ncbi:MAG TPA: dienelactone hydrolase family protein [Acidimicrobiales bacterium]|nr:dienelactone hydrolase family protein [Acidimicrobiales bacterium]